MSAVVNVKVFYVISAGAIFLTKMKHSLKKNWSKITIK